MIARLARPLLIVLVILGLLMPRISAAIAAVTPGVQTIIICTGDGLRTIHIAPDGKPIPTAQDHVDLCALAHASDTAMRADLPAIAAGLVAQVTAWTGDLVRLSAQQAARPPPRAPPTA